ncbi:hypothetical protein [Chitinophaga silvisoli]|uniref:DUF4221 domain-containing protein n=1 Tax=Chitinophaga silvisoli TaxID=2291814 RepID=A0A3E1NYB2_9BACT|nr:hypothetical protein [Chitinophaga silvisoli]RFM32910.1 hypothetical protein DXN04_20935 [Chitinophaga silvisoli]
MKRKLLILSALFCSAFIIMYILVRGAEPDRIVSSVSRQYTHYKLETLDTIAFPGRVSIMRAAGDNIYGYVYSKKTVFSYNTTQHRLDTFFNDGLKALPIITRIEISPDAKTFYLFDETQEQLTAYQPENKSIDSVSAATFLTRKGAQLHYKDSIIYEFTHFEDGGLSADGFFVHNSRYQFFIPFYHSGIVKYDPSDNKVATFQTIDQSPPINIAVPTGNIYARSPKAVIVNSTATADADHLYVLSYVLSQDAVKSGYRGPAIDVYNLSDSKYSGSFRLPGFQNKPVLQLAKCGDTLIAAYEKNILRFKLEQL